MNANLKAQVKRGVVAALGGTIIGAIVFLIAQAGESLAAGEAAIDRIKAIPLFGWLISFILLLRFDWFDAWVKSHPAFVIGLSHFGLFWIGLQTPWLRRTLHFRVWKERPFFLTKHLTDRKKPDRADAVSPETALTEFGGRSEDLDWLTEITSTPASLSWASLYGPPGRGKTRLAREWCAHLSALDWDGGLLDVDGDLGELRHWRPRRSTFVVVDEALRFSNEATSIFAHLSTISRKTKHKIRILFIDHAPFRPSLSEAQIVGRLDVDGTGHRPVLHHLLAPLTDDPTSRAIVQKIAPRLAPSRVDEALHAAGGEPLMLMILADMARDDDGPLESGKALARRADIVLKRAKDIDMMPILLQSCFGSPRPLPAGATRDLVASFLPDGRLTWDGKTLAGYVPDLIADAILVRGLAGFGAGDLNHFIKSGWTANPRMAGASLRRIAMTYRSETKAAIALAPGQALGGSDFATNAADDLLYRAAVIRELWLQPDGGKTATLADRAWFQACRTLAASAHLDRAVCAFLASKLEAARANCPEIASSGVSKGEIDAAMEAVYALDNRLAGEDLSLVFLALQNVETAISAWPDGPEAGYVKACAGVNAINRFGEHFVAGTPTAWEHLKRAVDAQKAIWQQANAEGWANKHEIGPEYVKGDVNALNHFGVAFTAGRPDTRAQMDAAIARQADVWQQALSENWPNQHILGLECVKCDVNILRHFGNAFAAGKSNIRAHLDNAIVRQQEVMERAKTEDWPNRHLIGMECIKGGVNMISAFGRAFGSGKVDTRPTLDKALATQQAVWQQANAENWPNKHLIGVEYVKCDVNTLNHFGAAFAAGKPNTRSPIDDAIAGQQAIWLQAVAENWTNKHEIGLECVKGDVNVLSSLGTAFAAGKPGTRISLEAAIARHKAKWHQANVENWSNKSYVGLECVKCDVNTIRSIGAAFVAGEPDTRAPLDEAIARQQAIWSQANVEKWANRHLVGLECAKGDVNTISRFGAAYAARKPDTRAPLEAAIVRHETIWRQATAETWANRHLLGLECVKGAANAITWCGKVEDVSGTTAGRARMLEIGKALLYHPVVGKDIAQYLQNNHLLDVAMAAQPRVTQKPALRISENFVIKGDQWPKQ